MLKLKISQRALLLFVFVSVTPVLALNIYWLATQQSVLKNEAMQRQILLTDSAANRTDNFITQKLNALILHSQTASILKGNFEESDVELSQYIKQDQDISSVVLINKQGEPVINMVSESADEATIQKLNKLDTGTAFKVVTFLGGKEYISPLTYINDKPHIQIAVPLTTFSEAQDFTKLSTSESGVIKSPDDISGALIVVVDLSGVWKSVFADNTDSPTFSYIVDDNKRIVGHPDQNYAKSNSDLSEVQPVSYFVDSEDSSIQRTIEANGLNNSRSLNSYARVPTTNWTVITEEPMENIEKAANMVARRVWIMNVFFVMAAIGISYVFSRRITKPIKQLALDANTMGSGNFDTQISIKSNDEIGVLGQSLNTMSQKLKTMIHKINADKEQLDVVLNSIDEGVFALDRKGNIQLVNNPALQLFNSANTQVINKPFVSIAAFRKDAKQLSIDVMNIDTSNGIVEFKDLQFTDANIKTRFVDIVVARLPHPEGNIEFIVTVTDQTASRELETMKVDFVSLAAHELRTPLTAMRGYLELILKDQKEVLNDKHRRFLLQANDSSSQLASLINNLLNVSKIERNALKMNKDKLDWTSIVKSSVANLQFSSEKANIALNYEGPDSDIFLIGDSVALREVIDNLISNALHYTPEKGSVVVRLRQDGDQIITSVHDTGIGIPQSSVDKLFTKFFRVHGGLATGSGGSGLGLYISKSIVESHEGSISVESKEGVGSVFSFSLPNFSQQKYDDMKGPTDSKAIRRKRGWITKNTAR